MSLICFFNKLYEAWICSLIIFYNSSFEIFDIKSILGLKQYHLCLFITK